MTRSEEIVEGASLVMLVAIFVLALTIILVHRSRVPADEACKVLSICAEGLTAPEGEK